MKYYPFGSSSFNIAYNTANAITASVSLYADTSSLSVGALSASRAIYGARGANGADGICVYTAGERGNTGTRGPGGDPGIISQPLPSGSAILSSN